MLLNSTMKQDNSLLAVDLTNPDLSADGIEQEIPHAVSSTENASVSWSDRRSLPNCSSSSAFKQASAAAPTG